MALNVLSSVGRGVGASAIRAAISAAEGAPKIGVLLKGRTGFWASHDSNHLLTYASAGTDVNGDRQVNRSDPNVAPREANPVRRDIIDLPGRRYRLGGSNILTFFVQGAFTY